MDANNWRPTTPGGEPVIDTGDWRIQLQPDSRKRIVDKIMETLKRHLLFSGQERLQELKKFTIHFEEKIYTTATNQSDYLHKISLEMLSMEIKSQNAMPTAHIDPAAWQTSLPLSLRRLQQVSKLLGINLSGYLEEKKKVKKTRKIVYLKDLRKEWKAKGYYQRMDTPSFDS